MPVDTDQLAARIEAMRAELANVQQVLTNAGNLHPTAATFNNLMSYEVQAAKTKLDAVITELQSIQTGVTATAATLTTALTGTNNDLVFTATANYPGQTGNVIAVTYVDPGGATATLGVVVTGTEIVVNLGRAASAINTTGTLLKAAYDAVPAAVALATTANAGGNDGTGLVTAMTRSLLTGGAN